MKFLDSHCHVDLAKNRESFVKEINQQQIYTISVTNLPTLFEKNRTILPESKYLKHALGYHPELIGEFPDQLNHFKKQVQKTRYIGEIGIDGSHRYQKSLSRQLEIFESILSVCEKNPEKILTIHSRKAEKQVTELIKQYPDSKKILHWYTGDIKHVEELLKVGCYFSVNKQMVLTAKGSMLIKAIPLERILLESDYPFGLSSDLENLNDYFNEVIESIASNLTISASKLRDQIGINQRKILGYQKPINSINDIT